MKTLHIEKLMKERLSSGACGNALSVYKNGEKLYEVYMGKTFSGGNKAVDENTLFRIYSMTKVIIAAAAMMLFERGEFLLTDPISKFLPEFENPMVCHHTFEGKPYLEPAKNSLTIESLLSMTSGIVSGGESYASRKYTEAMIKVNEETNGNPMLKDKVMAMGSLPLAFEPGTRWRYGAGLNVIGRLVEVISGKRLGEFLSDEIFMPLGMKETAFFREKSVLDERLCALYEEREDEDGIFDRTVKRDAPFYAGNRFEDPSGGLTSTLSDCMKFADALCCGRLMHPRTVEIMNTNRLNENALSDFRKCAQNLSGYGFGLGVRTMMEPGLSGSLSSIGEFGWFGMAGSYMLMDPKTGLSVVYMEQVIPNFGWNFPHPRLRNAVYSAFLQE
ncbi:MAG: beta-lactamase family protein [Clostridia bacterium]|nr:beta-lactamase family protein [Clostridia bacterium]